MRILEAFGEPFSFGGQEAFVMNVLEHMDRSGMEFDLLTPYYNENMKATRRVRSWGGEVYALGCDFRPGWLRANAEAPIRRFLMEHSSGANKYDAIHIHSGSKSMLAMYARLADRAGIKIIIVHSHCTGVPGWKHTISKAMTAAELSIFPTDYCACSKEAGEWRFPERKCGNLAVLRNGIDVSRFRYDESARNKVRCELGIGDSTILIGNAGRLAFQKNQGFLIDLLAELRSTSGKDYRLLLAGDGDDRAALEEQAEKNGVRGEVIFAGAVDNIHELYQAFDVFAMPSRYEGLAIAVIEAQAAGLEVIASDAIPELASVTGNIRFISLEERESWLEALAEPHTRHPEAAEQVALNGFGIEEAAAAVRSMYLGRPE